jgi:hypothetical protein
MIAAHEGQVIPLASAITLFTCAIAGVPITNNSNANKQVRSRRFIAEFLC